MGSKTLSAKVSQAVLVIVLGIISLVMIIPILHVVASSFSSQAALI